MDVSLDDEVGTGKKEEGGKEGEDKGHDLSLVAPPTDHNAQRLTEADYGDIAEVTVTFEEDDDYAKWTIQVTRINGVKASLESITELGELVKKLEGKSPAHFPCTNFSFLRGSMRDEELQAFLDNFGGRIKKLVLDVHYCWDDEVYEPSVYKLKALLATQAPNIEYLRLQTIPDGWELPVGCGWKNKPRKGKSVNNLFGVQARIPNLKILQLPQDAPEWLANELTRVAPNLVENSRF